MATPNRSRTLRWKTPPPGQAQTNWSQIDRALREQPGKWALVTTSVSERAAKVQTSRLRHGEPRPGRPRHVLLEIGLFEVERRGREIYARFVGDVEQVAS